MRIGVVGLCQAPGVGMALQQLLEDHEVFSIEAIAARRENNAKQAADTLLGCELIFTHDLAEEFGPLGTAALHQRHRNIHSIPLVTFTGFHPDCIYIFDGHKVLRSPMEDYHSAIIAAAYTLGADVEATLRQFNAEVFSRLGYFDEFAKARAFLAKVMTSVGLQLETEWPYWVSRAPFMHTINHPKGFVLSSIAKLLAVKAELHQGGAATVEPVQDLLSLAPVWPWYPELAVGRQGSYLFKKPGHPDLVTGRGVFMRLRELVERSFAAYGEFPARVFSAAALERVRQVLQHTL
jgi:hypothetical protein